MKTYSCCYDGPDLPPRDVLTERRGFDRLPKNIKQHMTTAVKGGRLEFVYGYIAFTSL